MDPNSSPRPLLVTIKMAAQMLSVSERTVYRMIDCNQLAVVKVTRDAPRLRTAEILRIVGEEGAC